MSHVTPLQPHTHLRAYLSDLTLPEICVVCAQPATKSYNLMRTFNFGRHNVTVKLAVPMCESHYAQAHAKSPAERRCQQAGLLAGILVGVLGCVGLLMYWSGRGESVGIGPTLLAGFVGLGFGLIVWVGTLLWIAPRLADPAAKAARDAVRLTHLWPAQKWVELDFANPQVAELAARRLSEQGKAVEVR